MSGEEEDLLPLNRRQVRKTEEPHVAKDNGGEAHHVVQRGAWAVKPKLEQLANVRRKERLLLILASDALASSDLSGYGNQGVRRWGRKTSQLMVKIDGTRTREDRIGRGSGAQDQGEVEGHCHRTGWEG